MSHHYVILRGGTVVPGGDAPDATAIAWAWDTVLILGSDEEVTGISRGDSHFHDLRGAVVVPLDGSGRPDPADGVLEIGGRADLAVFEVDPRAVPSARPIAVVRSGRVVDGALPPEREHAARGSRPASGNRFERVAGR